MKAWHFSETAYPYLPDLEQIDSVRVTLPSRLFDPVKGAELWDRYLAEWRAADQLGLNVMINEHHGTATCMDPAAPIIAGVVARETEQARILILGNPVANRKDPVRVAEEMAMVDLLSHGRLEVGFVRGVPYEISATNTSPIAMTERMWEAHDLILKAWTSHDGAFSWQGRFFEHRQVNIWPRPYQQPHPPVWVTTMSPQSAKLVGRHGHVAATFLSGYDGTKAIFDSYREAHERAGLGVPAADRFAYAALVYTGRTHEEGVAGASKLLWYITHNKVPAHFANPAGYMAPQIRGRALRGERSPFAFDGLTFEELVDRGVVIAGDADEVGEQITRLSDYVGGIGHLLIMGQSGFLDHEETVRGLEQFAREVQPRLDATAGATV